MVGGHGGSLRRTPARASDAASSRRPLLAISPPVSQFKRKIEWPVETPSKPPPLRRPPPRGELSSTPSRPVSAATPRSAFGARRAKTAHGGSVMQRKPAKSVTKPACVVRTSGGARGLGLGSVAARGLQPTVVNSEEVPHYELQENASFWKENNVQVVIRVRPLNNAEKKLHSYNRCLKQESAQSITWIGHPETRFTFDHVACESVNQEVLFRVVGLPMVENCMAGYNSCVFSYGHTGSGKTHTMLAEISELGVKPGPECGMIPRIFELMIARIRADEESRRDEKLSYICKCSFLEIYNEQITDLLDPSSINLQLREDTVVGNYVENLTTCEVTCVGDIIPLLVQSCVNRKVSATNMNSASSRSHTVFTCTIQSRWEKDSRCYSRSARLNLVDLAGSERQTASGAEGERLKEASNINKSLSTLSHVIMSLGDPTCGYIHYRDSKLTFLLKDSLGGNSKTLIIANVSPSLGSSTETFSTLKFAQRARLIQNNAIVNEDSLGDVQPLQQQICVLKEELAVIKGQHALQTHRVIGAEEQCNADVVCHLRKERDSVDNELQMLRSQFDKLLQEKENAIECHLKSKKTIEDLSSEVLQLKSDIIDKEKLYEARLQELEIKMQEKDSDTAASLTVLHKEKAALQFEVAEAKGLAEQKSFEASILTAKFQDAQETMDNAESTRVKALMEANENSKFQAEKYKLKESSFIIEKDDLLSKISSLKMLLGAKELNYHDMEKKSESALIEANGVANELEEGIRHLKNFLPENLESVSSDVEWMKSKFCQFAELARTWLDDILLEIIGKDCAVSVLHLCHMGLLLVRVTGLHAENSFLQRGISESYSLISTLQAYNDIAKKELEMCSVLKGKLLLDINNSFGRIAKKEQEATQLSSRLDSLGKRILYMHAQEEEMLARADSMYNELSVLTEEIDATNVMQNEKISVLEKQLANAARELGAVSMENGELRFQVNHLERIADERKKYAEEKNEEIKLLERSNDDLESTVCALEELLENKVGELNTVSVLIEEIDATNRSALAAKSKENEELRRQLDEALILNGMLKDKMLEDLSLLQVNNAIHVNGMEGLNEYQSCNLLAYCHHEAVMINTMAKDIETIVLTSELEQHKAELQEHMLMCTEVLEGLKTKEILWKVDQELGSVTIGDLLEENSNIRTDLENLNLEENVVMCTEVLEELKTKEILWKIDQEMGSVIISDLLEENSNLRTDLENLERKEDEIMVMAERARDVTSLLCSLSKRD